MIILGNIWVLKQLKCEKRLLVSHSFHFIVAAENDKRSFLTVAWFNCFYVLGQVFSLRVGTFWFHMTEFFNFLISLFKRN